MLSRLNDALANALPVLCVVAGSSLIVIFIVAWLVREVAVRAIEKAAPDQVVAVIIALAGLVSPFRWIWPWSGKAQRLMDNDKDRPSAGGSHEAR
jgi:hypothetical protein